MQYAEWSIPTAGHGFTELTGKVRAMIRESGVRDGLCNVFLAHTSASLILGENVDPSVRRDLESFFARLIPEEDPRYEHDAEGPDDMPAHIRTVLTQNSVTMPVRDGELRLGTWQGLFLWEHRRSANERRISVTVW